MTYLNTIFTDTKETLLKKNEKRITHNLTKCSEIRIKLNNVDLKALVGNRSVVNAISEDWLNADINQITPMIKIKG